jgi:hypothetical protein
MVARRLRLEALESRRLMAMDLDAIPLTVDSSTDSRITFVDQPTNGPAIEQLAFATSDEAIAITSTANSFNSPVGNQDRGALFQQQNTPSKFIIETENYLVVLPLSYEQPQRTRLNLIKLSSDGGGELAGYVELDFQVNLLVRFGEQVVIFGMRDSTFSPTDPWSSGQPKSVVAILDPAFQKIVHQESFPEMVTNFAKLRDGLVIETIPMQFAVTHSALTEQPSVSNPDSSVSPHLISSRYRLGYLHRTEASFDISWQESTRFERWTNDETSLVTVTEQLTEGPGATTVQYTLQRWTVVGNSLALTASFSIASLNGDREYLNFIQISPDGTHLLTVRSYREQLDNQTWKERSIFDWFSLTNETLSLERSYISEDFAGQTYWIDDQRVAIVPNSATDTVRILQLDSLTGSPESKIQLAQPLQLAEVVRVDESHIAISGYAPNTPFPVTAPGEPLPENFPLWRLTGPRGAIVIIDVNTFQVVDEWKPYQRSIFDKPFTIQALPGFVAWWSYRTEADWSSTNGIVVAKINEQGKLETTQEFVHGPEWALYYSNGTSLYTLRSESIESHSWTDLSQVQWRISLPGDLPPGIGEVTTTVSPSPLDTNGDGVINPIDILRVINYINQAYARGESDDLTNLSDPALARFDFDGDSKILPTDALMMIASLNVVHATFDAQEKVENQESNTPETCFWDMVNSDTELPMRAAEEAIDDFFNNEVDVEEFGGDEQWWDWFAPWDPMAEKMKIRLIGMSFPGLGYSLDS